MNAARMLIPPLKIARLFYTRCRGKTYLELFRALNYPPLMRSRPLPAFLLSFSNCPELWISFYVWGAPLKWIGAAWEFWPLGILQCTSVVASLTIPQANYISLLSILVESQPNHPGLILCYDLAIYSGSTYLNTCIQCRCICAYHILYAGTSNS